MVQKKKKTGKKQSVTKSRTYRSGIGKPKHRGGKHSGSSGSGKGRTDIEQEIMGMGLRLGKGRI